MYVPGRVGEGGSPLFAPTRASRPARKNRGRALLPIHKEHDDQHIDRERVKHKHQPEAARIVLCPTPPSSLGLRPSRSSPQGGGATRTSLPPLAKRVAGRADSGKAR